MGHWKDLKNTAHHHIDYVRSPSQKNESKITSELSIIEQMVDKYKLTVRQQLQVLHYLGVLAQYEGMNNHTKQAKELAKTLGKRSSQQIREILIRYNGLVKKPKESARAKHVKSDLEYLLTVFTQENRLDIVSQIKGDLSKLS